MHHTAVLSLFSSVFLLGGLSAAAPVASSETCEPQIICVDAVNKCGIKYGGCYDVCDLSAKPIPPPCPTSTTKKPAVPTTTKRVTTKKPVLTTTKKTTTKKPPVTSTKKIITSTTRCSATATVCWDGINECGMMYGGCFPDCKPWPTFTPPPCPTKATPPVLTWITTLPTVTVHNDE